MDKQTNPVTHPTTESRSPAKHIALPRFTQLNQFEEPYYQYRLDPG